MTRLDTEPLVQLEGDPGHRVRVVNRGGSGEIHLDCPAACILGPRREVLSRAARDEYAQIALEHRVFFRDVYGHLVRTHDMTESPRDLISGPSTRISSVGDFEPH